MLTDLWSLAWRNWRCCGYPRWRRGWSGEFMRAPWEEDGRRGAGAEKGEQV